MIKISWIFPVLLGYLPTIIFSHLAAIDKYKVDMKAGLAYMSWNNKFFGVMINLFFCWTVIFPNKNPWFDKIWSFFNRVHYEWSWPVWIIKLVLYLSFTNIYVAIENDFEYTILSVMMFFLFFTYTYQNEWMMGLWMAIFLFIYLILFLAFLIICCPCLWFFFTSKEEEENAESGEGEESKDKFYKFFFLLRKFKISFR